MQLRARDGPAARRHRRRALPAPRGLPPPRGAAVRADEVDARAAEDVLRHQRVLPEELGGDGGSRSPTCPEALASTLEIAERCDVSIELGGQLIPRFETPDGEPERDYLRALVDDGLRLRYGDPVPAAARRARRHGARRDRPDGLQRLLPDRVGLRRLREVQRHRGRPGPRLGGRLDRRLLPADHRRRPAALRPAVRALPERRARVDAGHRHRLLRARPGARDPLRDREVRRRPRGADHHLRQDVPARRDARRRARARPRVRDRRPAGEADPRPAAGPAAELRRLPRARRGARQRGRAGTRRPSRSSTSRRASRGSSATRRSTPPRS